MQAAASLRSDDFYLPSHVPPELVQPFDLFADPEIMTSPFTRANRLRDHGRVFWNPINTVFRGSWVLTHADDLRQIMSNPQTFSSKGQAGFTAAQRFLRALALGDVADHHLERRLAPIQKRDRPCFDID